MALLGRGIFSTPIKDDPAPVDLRNERLRRAVHADDLLLALNGDMAAAARTPRRGAESDP